MGLFRFLLALVATLAAIAIVRAILAKLRKNKPHDSRKVFGQMVACAHCGTHVPSDQAIWRGEKSFCCEAHQKMDLTP